LKDEVKADALQIEAFKDASKAVFPNATSLKTSEQVAAQREAIDAQRRSEKEAGNEDNK
jgi:hypothetical protein